MVLLLRFQGPVSKYLSRAQNSSKGSLKGSSGHKADLEAIGQAHISAVAGACLSIGIKFAGSGDAAAEQVLRHYVLYFLKARQQAPDSASGDLSFPFPFSLASLPVPLSVFPFLFSPFLFALWPFPSTHAPFPVPQFSFPIASHLKCLCFYLGKAGHAHIQNRFPFCLQVRSSISQADFLCMSAASTLCNLSSSAVFVACSDCVTSLQQMLYLQHICSAQHHSNHSTTPPTASHHSHMCLPCCFPIDQPY